MNTKNIAFFVGRAAKPERPSKIEEARHEQ